MRESIFGLTTVAGTTKDASPDEYFVRGWTVLERDVGEARARHQMMVGLTGDFGRRNRDECDLYDVSDGKERATCPWQQRKMPP